MSILLFILKPTLLPITSVIFINGDSSSCSVTSIHSAAFVVHTEQRKIKSAHDEQKGADLGVLSAAVQTEPDSVDPPAA